MIIYVIAWGIVRAGFVVLRSTMRVAALDDVLWARQKPHFPRPEHIGIVWLQVFMMQWRWFGRSIPDPFTVLSQESAIWLPHSQCSYCSWGLKENSLMVKQGFQEFTPLPKTNKAATQHTLHVDLFISIHFGQTFMQADVL